MISPLVVIIEYDIEFLMLRLVQVVDQLVIFCGSILHIDDVNPSIVHVLHCLHNGTGFAR